MPRPNYAQDAPPTTLTVGGASYDINVDYRVWIDVMHALNELVSAPTTVEQAAHNLEVISKIEMAVFGRIIPNQPSEVIPAVAAFAGGYPEAPTGEGGKSVRAYSLDWDINYIIIAIMNQFGVDLSYRRTEPFHFWEFLLYFRTLCGDHHILRLMDIRSYDGKDAEMKKQAQRFALPRENTADDQVILDAFDEIFYNS